MVQPYPPETNLVRFPVKLLGDYSSHIIDWKLEKIDFQMIHGHYRYAPDYFYFIKEWTYLIHPVYSGNERFIINLWQYQGMTPSNGQEA